MSNIDWTKLITKKDKEDLKTKSLLLGIASEMARLRLVADHQIITLQDAVDLDDASDDDLRMLKLWKTYRVALSRVPQQAEYPNNIVWPIQPDTANG